MRTSIEVSARHIHLSEQDFFTLFHLNGMMIRNILDSEKGAFASRHCVEIVGGEGKIHNVRVLGPFRQRSQLEISRSDAVFLDINAPAVLSGSNCGARVRVIGPKGEIIKNIAMVALRHWHISDQLGQKLKLNNGKRVEVCVSGERALVFKNVIVRIKPEYRNHIHIDTDEGNAAGIDKIARGEVKIL